MQDSRYIVEGLSSSDIENVTLNRSRRRSSVGSSLNFSAHQHKLQSFRRTPLCIAVIFAAVIGIVLQIGLLVGWNLITSHVLIKKEAVEKLQGHVLAANVFREAESISSGNDLNLNLNEISSANKNPYEPIAPRTFEMMTADISDLRSSVLKLSDELLELRNEAVEIDNGKQTIENSQGILSKSILHDEMSEKLKSLNEELLLTKEMLMATVEALLAVRIKRGPVENQKRVLIVSEPRAGSTQFGELFNCNNDLFYLDEPCKGGGEGGSALYDESCGFLIQRLLTCNPTVQDVSNMFRDSLTIERSRALQSLQRLGKTLDEPQSISETINLLRELVISHCKQSSGVVIKEIRTTEVQVEMLPKGTKLVHFVRDPRDAMFGAIAMWRAQEGGLEFQSNEYCRRTLAKLNSVFKMDPSNRVIITFEQLTADIFSTVNKIYKWADLGPLTSSVQKAIEDLKSDENLPHVGVYMKGLTSQEQSQVLESCNRPMKRLRYIVPSNESSSMKNDVLEFPETAEDLLNMNLQL